MSQLAFAALFPTCVCGHPTIDHTLGLCPWCACPAVVQPRLSIPANPIATRAAARAAIAPLAPGVRRRVYEAIRDSGGAGLTAEEAEDATNLSGNTVRPRLMELAEEGRIMRAPRVRLTRSKRTATIWVVTP